MEVCTLFYILLIGMVLLQLTSTPMMLSPSSVKEERAKGYCSLQRLLKRRKRVEDYVYQSMMQENNRSRSIEAAAKLLEDRLEEEQNQR